MFAEPFAIHLNGTSLILDLFLLPAHSTLIGVYTFILNVSLGTDISMGVANQVSLSLYVTNLLLPKIMELVLSLHKTPVYSIYKIYSSL